MQTDTNTIINEVLGLKTVTPDTYVNDVMTRLVESVIATDNTAIPTYENNITLRVRRISAEAETEMEKFWARRIISSPDPRATLNNFPYIQNYSELTRREIALVGQSGLVLNDSHSALVVGSGPLPLSAYELYKQSGASVDQVDSSPQAIDLARHLGATVGVPSTYYSANGQDVVLDKQYDLILIAALAGETIAEKQAIIDNVMPWLTDTGRIIIRSAKGGRALLYPVIAASDIRGVLLLAEYHPDDYVINSVLVYGKQS